MFGFFSSKNKSAKKGTFKNLTFSDHLNGKINPTESITALKNVLRRRYPNYKIEIQPYKTNVYGDIKNYVPININKVTNNRLKNSYRVLVYMPSGRSIKINKRNLKSTIL
tara:strand:+ start:486 stop:815 length:330 start_codon:yes stop_codon:yes gene_type:complete